MFYSCTYQHLKPPQTHSLVQFLMVHSLMVCSLMVHSDSLQVSSCGMGRGKSGSSSMSSSPPESRSSMGAEKTSYMVSPADSLLILYCLLILQSYSWKQ